jgi:hypothetical protein
MAHCPHRAAPDNSPAAPERIVSRSSPDRAVDASAQESDQRGNPAAIRIQGEWRGRSPRHLPSEAPARQGRTERRVLCTRAKEDAAWRCAADATATSGRSSLALRTCSSRAGVSRAARNGRNDRERVWWCAVRGSACGTASVIARRAARASGYPDCAWVTPRRRGLEVARRRRRASARRSGCSAAPRCRSPRTRGGGRARAGRARRRATGRPSRP